MAQKDSTAAASMLDLIKDLISEEIKKTDQTILCRVVSHNADDTYDVFVVPDESNIVRNIKSITAEIINEGDYVYLYQIQNKLNNSVILTKVGAPSRMPILNSVQPGSQSPVTSDAIYQALQNVSSGGSGGSGVQDVRIIGDSSTYDISVVDTNNVANIRSLDFGEAYNILRDQTPPSSPAQSQQSEQEE